MNKKMPCESVKPMRNLEKSMKRSSTKTKSYFSTKLFNRIKRIMNDLMNNFINQWYPITQKQ